MIAFGAGLLMVIGLGLLWLGREAWLYDHWNECFWLLVAGATFTALGGWGVFR